MNHTLCIASIRPCCSSSLFVEDEGVSYNYDVFYQENRSLSQICKIFSLFNVYPLSVSSVFSSIPIPYMDTVFEQCLEREHVFKWTTNRLCWFPEFQRQEAFPLSKHMITLEMKNMIVIEKLKEETVETTVIGDMEEEEMKGFKDLLKTESSKEDKVNAIRSLLKRKAT